MKRADDHNMNRQVLDEIIKSVQQINYGEVVITTKDYGEVTKTAKVVADETTTVNFKVGKLVSGAIYKLEEMVVTGTRRAHALVLHHINTVTYRGCRGARYARREEGATPCGL